MSDIRGQARSHEATKPPRSLRAGLLRVVLEVRYILATQSRQDKPIWHVGCSFPKLSSAAETTIQRFMAKIEIERRALAID